MKAIIPIAGKGTRMRPLTLNHPKVLLPVAGKPMIDYIIEALVQNNILDIIFIVGFLGEEVAEYIRKNWPQVKSHFVEQEEMLGLGHAVLMAEPFVEDEEVFIVLGDTLFDVDFKAMVSTKTSNLGVKKVSDPSRFGVAVLEGGYIRKLVEKPQQPVSDLALVGLYYVKEGKALMQAIQKLIRKNIKTKDEYQLTDALQLLLDDGIPFQPFLVENWYDCGKPETILQTSAIILDKRKDKNSFEQYPSCKILEPVYIGENVKIKRSIIGPYVSIMDNCTLENVTIENSIVGRNSIIKNVNVKNSIIGDSVTYELDTQQQLIGDYTIIK